MNTPATHTSPRIMVIDDSQATRNLAAAYLRHFDPQVITAASAEEGLALARIHRPDLVLCDVVLPGQNGFSFVAALRMDPDLERTLVVLMSAVSAMQDRVRAVDCGADDLLTKPFDRAELVARVRALLRLKAREDALHQANVQLRERMYLMSILFMVGNQLSEGLDPADIYRIIRQTLVTIVGAETFAIFLREGDSSLYRLVTVRGVDNLSSLDVLDAALLPQPLATALDRGLRFVHDGPPSAAPVLPLSGPADAMPVLVMMPLLTRHATIGFITIYSFSQDHGDDPDVELLALLSGQVAGSLQQVRLHTQLQRYVVDLAQDDRSQGEVSTSLEAQMFHLKTISLFSTQLHGTINLPDIYEAMRDLLINIIGVGSFFVYYFDQWEGLVSYAGAAEGESAPHSPADAAQYTPLVRHVQETGATSYFQNVAEPGSKALLERLGIPAPFACLPLIVDKQVRGVLIVDRLLAHKRDLRREDYELLALLSREAAVALHNGYLHRHVERLSLTDTLTGAYNRRYFDIQLRAELKRGQRSGHPMTLAMCDIDDFKTINDHYGHPVGDIVLRDVVRRLSRTLRDVDILARYGGEEFAIILPDTATSAGIVVATRVCHEVSMTPIQAGDLALDVTVSLGVASLPPCLDELALIQGADEALLQAKRAGKNRVAAAPAT